MLKNPDASAGRPDEQFETLTKFYNESMRQRATCNALKICTTRFETARRLLIINRQRLNAVQNKQATDTKQKLYREGNSQHAMQSLETYLDNIRVGSQSFGPQSTRVELKAEEHIVKAVFSALKHRQTVRHL